MQDRADSAATVTVRPRNFTFGVVPGQSVYEAAVDNGIRWPTTCEGMGTCRLCYMSVISGADRLNAVEPFEAEGLADIVDTSTEGTMRLACQARPSGDIVVVKRGARELPGRRDAGRDTTARQQSGPSSGATDE